MVGQLPLEQHIGVRIPGGQPDRKKSDDPGCRSRRFRSNHFRPRPCNSASSKSTISLLQFPLATVPKNENILLCNRKNMKQGTSTEISRQPNQAFAIANIDDFLSVPNITLIFPKCAGCFVLGRWRREPLRDDETTLNLISGTTTAKGLRAACRLDRRKNPAGRRVTDEEIGRANLKKSKFHGEWNYTIRPSTP